MSIAGFVVGYADCVSDLSVHELANVLSSRAFGGIRFVEKIVDGEHDLGTLTLEHDFVGIQVDLFGANGTYTLEIGTRPSASVKGCPDVCDLTQMILQRLSQISEVTVESRQT